MSDALAAFESSRPRAVASQATTIEQSRAVAEVQAAVVLAQSRPRDRSAAVSEMREVTAIDALAERAFFSFKRGGENVSGATIHLARELARIWGNVDYGVKELSRDDARGVSEMLAFAWDLQTNTRTETTFLVPHKRDTKSGRKALVDLRDIYENNANNAARRLRECIFGILPVWLTDDAQERCRETLAKGGGKPLEIRVADAIGHFGRLGVGRDRLEARIGRPASAWRPEDVAGLGVLARSLKNGETTIDAEFDEETKTTGDAATAFERAATGEKPPATERADARHVPDATAAQSPEATKPKEETAPTPAENPAKIDKEIDPPADTAGNPAEAAADPVVIGELVPEARGRTGQFYWPKWEDAIRALLGKCSSAEDVDALEAGNKQWLAKHRLARPKESDELVELFALRRRSFAPVE